MRILLSTQILATVLTLTPWLTMADEIRVAVASNFADAAKSIARHFESSTGHKVILAYGSTGRHYAQIINGAPFDVFLAADAHRPDLLEKAGTAVAGSRFTYAVGKLVLWSPVNGYVDTNARVLQGMKFRFLAIANPKLAPYGTAAREVLQAHGLWGRLKGRIVRGENIGQAFQYVKSGNAELGFIAYSQLKRTNQPIVGSTWVVPQMLYRPIEQQAVLLKDGLVARSFLSFLRSDTAMQVIHDYGYEAMDRSGTQ